MNSIEPEFIEPEQLVTLIREEKVQQDYLIIDVRDEDFAGGNIPHAVNIPLHQLWQDALGYARKFRNVKTLIFHCAQSRIRGPKGARIIAESYAILHGKETHGPTDLPHIRVLRGGFDQWLITYHNQADLVENYNEKIRAKFEFY